MPAGYGGRMAPIFAKLRSRRQDHRARRLRLLGPGEPATRRASGCRTPRATSEAKRTRHGLFRLLHLMALVAAAALTLIVTPALMPVVRSPLMTASGKQLFIRRLADQTSLALIFWTPILVLIAVSGNAPAPGGSAARMGSRRSWRRRQLYFSSSFGACAGRCFISGTPAVLPVVSVIPKGANYCPTVEKIVDSAPEGAAAAIVAVWSILALTRVGRWPSDWFERFCVLFGLLWVVWYIARDFVLHLPW